MVAGTAADAEAEEGWPKPNPVVVDGPSAGADDAEEVVAPEPKPKTFPEEDEEEEEGGGGGGGGGDDEDDDEGTGAEEEEEDEEPGAPPAVLLIS